MAALSCQSRRVSSGGHIVPQLLPLEVRHRGKQHCDPAFKASPVKLRAMESVRSAFHTQLATVMDSLLAAAVCEIAKIFEGSLCEQQAELVQKTEEILILRGKLEKVERRLKTKSGGVEEGGMSPGEREGSTRQEAMTGSGSNVEKDASSHPHPVEGLGQSLSGLKEEVTGPDGTSVKPEFSTSGPPLGSDTVLTAEGSLAAGEQRQTHNYSMAQVKAKMSQWEQGSRSADHRPGQDQALTPFLSISQSGHCSPRTDPGLTQSGDWLPALEATRGGMSGLGNLQADGTSCPGPASSSTGTGASCFRPGFGSDETSNEDDESSFPFLDQEPENRNSNQILVPGQGVGPREAQMDQPQPHTDESQWRPRDDRAGRGTVNHAKRAIALGNRDPLRLQSNTQSLTLRHTNTLSHPPAPGGGNGRPYTCPYCTKCFTYPSHQRRHLLRHTGVRLHPCQFCDKSFLTPSELTVHTRTHTGERPFGCAQCGKRFARSGNLRAHQRDVHMGKRPFACTECGKRFAHRGNLRVHNHRVHQGDPYYMEDQQEPDIGPNPI